MVVARIGVAAVAVVRAAGQGFLVVALYRGQAAPPQDLQSAVGMGPESPEVTEQEDRLRAQMEKRK